MTNKSIYKAGNGNADYIYKAGVRLSSRRVLSDDGWMTCDYVLFSSISVISGGWAYDNERLCATEPRLLLR